MLCCSACRDKLNDSAPQTQIGTALFTAPEIFTNVQGQAYDAEAADLWSCGIVLFVMLFGQHPFLASEDPDMKRHAQVMMLIENSVKGQIQVRTHVSQHRHVGVQECTFTFVSAVSNDKPREAQAALHAKCIAATWCTSSGFQEYKML